MLTIPFIIESILIPSLLYGFLVGGILFLLGLLVNFAICLFSNS